MSRVNEIAIFFPRDVSHLSFIVFFFACRHHFTVNRIKSECEIFICYNDIHAHKYMNYNKEKKLS